MPRPERSWSKKRVCLWVTACMGRVGLTAGPPATLINKSISLESSPEASHHAVSPVNTHCQNSGVSQREVKCRRTSSYDERAPRRNKDVKAWVICSVTSVNQFSHIQTVYRQWSSSQEWQRDHSVLATFSE